MKAVTEIKRQQLEWARREELEHDGRGYLSTVQQNLFAPLSSATTDEFHKGDGGELIDRGSKPAKMRALHSSSALAVNFFEFRRNQDIQSLSRALGIQDPIETLQFEVKQPTGLQGKPPNLDLLLTTRGGVVAVESKFTEAYSRRPSTTPFKPKYFPTATRVWNDVGLKCCQSLAEEIDKEPRAYGILNAAQLLKHALGIACAGHHSCSLLYLYYDWDGPEGEEHREELKRFENHLSGEVGFRSLSYQAAFDRLSPPCLEDDQGWVQYMRARYFS